MTLARWVPGIAAARSYERAWLTRDLVAGVVLATLIVPQGMAYAELAGLPAITGLYATVLCLLTYAAFGPSRILVLGPDSSLGPMIAATILPLAAGNPDTAVALAGVLALMVGAICVATGVLRFGFVADLLSTPVRVGYLAGLAVVIFIGQLPKLFGFSTDASGFFDEIAAFFQELDETNLWALGIGLASLATIVGLQRIAPRLPGILVAVVGAIGISIALDLASHGVSVVGVLPQGFPRPALPQASLTDLPLLFAGALGISLVAIGDTISTSGGFAARSGREVDANQELLGIGSANMAAGLFSGMAVSTSGSRTAVAAQSGAKSQLTGVVAAGLVLAMLLFVPGLVQSMPQSTLAAVIMAASISLLDVSALRRLFVVRRTEFYLAAACGLGVILYGVLPGILLAVALSMLNVFRRAWTPHSAVLGEAPGVPGWHSVRDFPDARQVPGLLIIRWSAPLFFANANQFRDLVRKLVKEAPARPSWVLIAAAPITDIDTTAGTMLESLDAELNAAGVHLAFAELQTAVRDRIVRYGLLETIDATHFYRSVTEGVEVFRRESGA